MISKAIIETPRVYLREICDDDFCAIAKILQDIEVMYAWEHAFSDDEVVAWINENKHRYQHDGYSYWVAIEKGTSSLIGVCGILAETADGEDYTGVGYIFNKAFWHQGYAFECAAACKEYAFSTLKVPLLTAQIRPENTASRHVATKLGMAPIKQFNKLYKGKTMPHILYGCTTE